MIMLTRGASYFNIIVNRLLAKSYHDNLTICYFKIVYFSFCFIHTV